MRLGTPFFKRLVPLTCGLLVIAVAAVTPLVAQLDPETRPRTQELLPETTVMFVQIDNFEDMMLKSEDSRAARMLADEDIAPLLEGLWDEAKLAYEDVKDEVGLELDDFTNLPKGELTFAIIAPRRKTPEFFLLMELNEEGEALNNVLDRTRQAIEEEGNDLEKETEDADGIEYESFIVDGKKIKFFRMGGLLVGCSSEEELDAFVDRWADRDVDKVRPLDQNRKFVTIMNRCKGTKDIDPEARFFIDPIGLAKSSTRGNLAASAPLAFLPVLGLDGLAAIGGSILLDEEEFESVVHGHVMLANPRNGLFEMMAMKPTMYEPEPWIPKDIINYMTTSWDVDQFLAELTSMIENFYEEGTVDTWIEENINQEVGLDLKEDVLAHMTGRITWVQWVEEPVRINSQVNAISLGVSDLEAFEASLEKIVARINNEGEEDEDEEENDDRLEEIDYKGIRIWSQSAERMQRRLDNRRQRRAERAAERGEEVRADVEINVQQPAFALVGDNLILAQSLTVLQHCIDVDQGDVEALVNDETYGNIAERMTKLMRTDMPCAMMYSNPQESMRMMYELLYSDETQALMADGAEENKYLAGIRQRLEDNPLPEFDKLKKYFAPSGMYVTDDDTGFHFLGFTMREDPNAEEDE